MEGEVQITCLCGAAREVVLLNTDPSKAADICHCNICRWTTGALFYYALPLMARPNCVDSLTRYDSSDRVTRYFCGACGTHICHHVHRDDSWHVAWGAVDEILGRGATPLRIAEHQFVGDTVDGGLAVCLTGSTQVPARFYMQAANGVAMEPVTKDSFSRAAEQTQVRSRVQAACHCGQTEFYLSRPDEQSRQCSSPWPDLLRPYHSCDPANPDDEKWWLREGGRYLAGTCACRTCRLAFSAPITTWAFIPKSNLIKEDGSSLELDSGPLRSFSSSKGRTRYFCGTCGASAFLRIDERPELIDVAVGLLRAEEGARAESWLEWFTTRLSFVEEAFDKDFAAVCEAGLKNLK